MSDELALLGILCLLYVTDCFLWVGKQSLVFVTWTGWQWRDWTANELLRTAAGGILLLNPFPPLGKVFGCHLPPLSLSPSGVCYPNCQTLTYSADAGQEIVATPFEEILAVGVSGRDVSIDDRFLCRCRIAGQAERIGALLNSLRSAAAEMREAIIEQFWQEQFQVGAARIRLQQASRPMRHLRVLCNVLFVHLFVFAPVVVVHLGMLGMLIPIALGMLFLAVLIAAKFSIAHKKLFPAAGEDRIGSLAKMILCAPVAIRACDLITESLLSGYHPLVAGHLLLPGDQYQEFAARTLRDLKYAPLDPALDGCTRTICNWHRETLLRMASAYLRDQVDLQEAWFAPPRPDGPRVRAYCPRCLCQFTHQQGDCPDCSGVELLPFRSRVSADDANE